MCVSVCVIPGKENHLWKYNLLEHCYSKWCPWISTIGITWELVRTIGSVASHQIFWIRIWILTRNPDDLYIHKTQSLQCFSKKYYQNTMISGMSWLRLLIFKKAVNSFIGRLVSSSLLQCTANPWFLKCGLRILRAPRAFQGVHEVLPFPFT